MNKEGDEMTSVFSGKIRRWYICKPAIHNRPHEEDSIQFVEFKPTICKQGYEWIPVISLDDFHKEVNINISRWVEVAQQLAALEAENCKLKELVIEVAKSPNYMTTFAWAELQTKAKELVGDL